jgi:hypothetical protein
MRLIRNSFVALFLLAVAGIIGMRVSAPYRHNREFQSKLPFFQNVISDLQASQSPSATSLTKVRCLTTPETWFTRFLRSALRTDALRWSFSPAAASL